MAGISEMTSPHTIVVNQAGQRFADESYFQSVVPALRKFDTLKHDYANLPCFLIFDEQFAQRYSLAHLPVGAAVPASIARAATVAELAEELGVDAGGLARTVERFNGFAAVGVDEDFQRGALRWRLADRSAEGRRNSSLGALDRPPFYGLELRPSLGTTSAGLLTDVNGQVLHQRRHPIAGLYASGVVAARTEIGAGYQAGLNLASAMTFSALAVEHMKRP
jgi:3-oxosteroid 1-dehydrogenase